MSWKSVYEGAKARKGEKESMREMQRKSKREIVIVCSWQWEEYCVDEYKCTLERVKDMRFCEREIECVKAWENKILELWVHVMYLYSFICIFYVFITQKFSLFKGLTGEGAGYVIELTKTLLPDGS